MTEPAETPPPPAPDLSALIAGIEAAGVTVNSAAALAWLAGVAAAAATAEEFAIAGDGFGGHELAVLDFDPAATDRLRRIGAVIGAPPAPDVQAALAIAGSAAQGRFQPFPADADFFERLHIKAETEAAARRRLAETLRANVAHVEAVPGFALDEAHVGEHPGGTYRWTLADVIAGVLRLDSAEFPSPAHGREARGEGSLTGEGSITWEAAAADPGFLKLDWILTDPALGGPGKVSKVVDATWEDAAGRVHTLDEFLDADVQQIYLEPAAAALAASLTRHIPTTERERYISEIQREVRTYSQPPANYGKVAKRLYNLCRLTGRYGEALFLRELFDEPPARLYQARTPLGLLRRTTGGDAHATGAALANLLDDLTDALADAPDCVEAATASRTLILTGADLVALDASIAQLDAALATAANRAFEARLRAYPPIATLLAEITA